MLNFFIYFKDFSLKENAIKLKKIENLTKKSSKKSIKIFTTLKKSPSFVEFY